MYTAQAGGTALEQETAEWAKRLRERAEAYAGDMVSWRRQVHRRPGLGFEVTETADLGASLLAAWGYRVERGLGRTGVKAVLTGEGRGGQAGRVETVLLRADMDGLPMEEGTGLPFASEIPGRMHACGHDMHVGAVLGAARLLSEVRSHFSGNVVIALQPAEEGPGGAEPMIADGLLRNPDVERAFMLHVQGRLLAGQVGVPQGYAAANCDDFELVITGRTAHGSRPQAGTDAIVAAGHVIAALQSVVARNVDPTQAAVVTLGTVHGGDNSNILADRVVLTGTLRSFDDGVRLALRERVAALAKDVARAFGAEAELTLDPGYPAFRNDKAAGDLLLASAAWLYGPDAAVPIVQESLGAEDFAYIGRAVPAAIGALGVADREPGDRGDTHTRDFRPEERALPVGAATLAMAAWASLTGNPLRRPERGEVRLPGA